MPQLPIARATFFHNSIEDSHLETSANASEGFQATPQPPPDKERSPSAHVAFCHGCRIGSLPSIVKPICVIASMRPVAAVTEASSTGKFGELFRPVRAQHHRPFVVRKKKLGEKSILGGCRMPEVQPDGRYAVRKSARAGPQAGEGGCKSLISLDLLKWRIRDLNP